MSEVGKNIRLARERLGWTQEELARRMGYKSKSTVNKVEMGINDIPQNKILKYAQVLGVSPSHLMGWVSEETNKKNDHLVEVIAKLRTDSDFYDLVSMLAEIPAEQRASIASLVSALRAQK
ncbi:MAG: helix-turn-helix transcriptional regulator [Clostridiales bacterium]|nr:helix-turn-helix transcriptional regulator [Clostridiales bacterium]